MRYKNYGISLIFSMLATAAYADERVCVDGEQIRFNEVQFLGPITNAYSKLGKPLRVSDWFDSVSQTAMKTHLYSGVIITTESDTSGYDRIERVVITQPSIKLPDNIQVGMTEKLLHTILNYKVNSHHPGQDNIWSGCNCYCETTVSFQMNNDRKLSKITINYGG